MAALMWSAEQEAVDYKDLQATAMDVDCSGELALLAGRRYLALIKLEKPQQVIKIVSRQSKWEVGTAEWNPHMSCENMFAISCNQKAEVIAWRESQLTTVQSLRAHTRIIGDLNWSPFDPNLLATCSVDNYTFIWDVRDSRRPVLSLTSIAGVSKVRWNRVSNNLLATSNEGDVRIWDQRKNSCPLLYLAAHTKRILGLDWNPNHECQLATCSQECTVKFWDISNPRHVENVNTINSAFPVWRAQYTPFGQGLITVVLPQLRRGENGVFLWSMSNLTSPIHTFVGHTDVVLNFAWRRQKEDREYQLVSWSKDHHLRIWKMDSQLQKMCGCDMDITDTSDPDVGLSDPVDTLEVGSGLSQALAAERSVAGTPFSTTKSADEKSDLASSISLPRTLQQEFSLVNINIPNVTIDEMDAIKRSCNISAVNGRHIVKLQMSFPASYPFNSAPTFQFCKGTTIDTAFKSDLLAALRTTSQHHVKRNRTCLEPCLRQLKLILDSFLVKEQSANLLDTTSSFRLEPGLSPFLPAINTYGSFQDVSVPFPRTSGARFCGVGLLVSFSPPSHFKRLSNPGESTPRSLSALVAYASNPIHTSTPTFNIYSSVAQSPSTETGVSVSSYYYQDRKTRSRGKSIRDGESHGSDLKSNKAGTVVMYDVSSLLPLNRGLAESYLLNPRDISTMCAKNANAALTAGRKDLVQLWSIVTLIANPSLNQNSDHNTESPWAHHPFGRRLLQSLMNHYIKIGDIQTVAMLCCVFLPNFPEKSTNLKKTARIADTAVYTLPSGKWRLKPGGSPYHTIHPGDTKLDGFNLGVILKTSRSNSWSDSLDDHETRYGNFNTIESRDHESDFKDTSSIQFLDKKQSVQYDRYKKLYAEILHRWGLLQRRTQVLKFVKGNPDLAREVEFVTKCQNCGKDVYGFRCSYCKNFSFPCAICHIAVKGASNFCLLCGHGGHAKHMLHWFTENDSCPRGCGCLCLQECNE